MKGVWWLLPSALLLALGTGGWLGMIRMPGASYEGPLPPMTSEETVLKDELQRHVYKLGGEIGERNVWRYERLQQAADYIRTELAGMGHEVRSQEYTVMEMMCENIEVEIPGTTHPDEIVLIGAHYDSVRGSPGANDNASGVAAMLALARTFAKTQPARTVRFVAFVNEEPPFFQSRHMGSRVYAKRSRERGEQIILMISLETIGYYADAPRSQRYPFPLQFIYPSTGNFIAFVSNTDNASWVRRTIGAFRQQGAFPSEGAALFGWLPGVGWSDHWAFWKEGFPAIMVTDTALFRDPYYHTGRDLPQNIHYEYLTRVVSGLRHVIRDLADQPHS